MHKNGYVYVEATKMMLPFIPFAQAMYPLKFEGVINWDGKISLKVSERNLALFGKSLPEEFIGSTNPNGKVEIRLVKTSFEWSGEHYLHKLLFDPFKGNEKKRTKFIENTIHLKQRIQKYLDEL